MVNSERLKTVNLYEKRDPIRNLWRNVLIVGIEDLIKKKTLQYQWNRKAFCLEEMWFHHDDFKLICEFAQLEHAIVKRKVFKAIEEIKEKYEKREVSMPSMSREWLYKDKEISRRSKRWHSSMFDVQ
jgi:flagellar biosynthesis regulator FlbT|tara:strand:- start:24 stop:404 length:381 start_codon:yes stop_codon:yes gene_type:complete